MMNTITLTARAIMTPEVITVQVDDSIPDAAQLLLDARISGAPVIDRWGNAVGVFSLSDAVDFNNNTNGSSEDSSEETSRDTNGDSPTSEEKVIKSPDDESFYNPDLPHGWPPSPLTMKEPLKDMLVGDIMTPRVHSVPDTAAVSEVAGYLLDRGIHRILVRDADNKLVGIITSMDLLRVLADVLDGKFSSEE